MTGAQTFARNARRASDGKLMRPRLYRVWSAIKTRCRNPNHDKWRWYGGRGVSICAEWDSYSNFRNWAVSSGYSKGMSIDRIDSSGDYEPTNCQWLTVEENRMKRWQDVR